MCKWYEMHNRAVLQIKKFKNNYFHSKVYCTKMIWGRLGRGEAPKGGTIKK